MERAVRAAHLERTCLRTTDARAACHDRIADGGWAALRGQHPRRCAEPCAVAVRAADGRDSTMLRPRLALEEMGVLPEREVGIGHEELVAQVSDARVVRL